MGDPELQGFGLEAQSIGAAEPVGDHHGHVTDQAALIPLQHQRQPGVAGVGPQRPQPRFGAFCELARVVGLARPVEAQLQGRPLGENLPQGSGCPRLQWREIETTDRIGIDLDRFHGEV